MAGEALQYLQVGEQHSPPQLSGARQLGAAHPPLTVELLPPDAEHQQEDGGDPRGLPVGTAPIVSPERH